jgi:SGNH domain-containing protein
LHWPVLIIAVLYEGHELSVGVKMLLLLGAFLLSIVTYRCFEDPIRRARWNAPASAILVPASVAAVVVVTMLALSSINAKTLRLEGSKAAAAPPRITNLQYADNVVQSRPLRAVVAAVKAARRGAKLPTGLNPPVSELVKEAYNVPSGCAAADNRTTSNICRLGDTSGAKSIVLIGDSHAEMWMPTILQMAQRDGWVVIPIIKSGCVPSSWIGKGYPDTPGAKLRECHSWYRWALAQAKKLRPDVTMATGCCGGADGTTADAAKLAFRSLAATMKRFSRSVVVVADDDGVDKQPVG